MIVWCGDKDPHTAHGACPGYAEEHVEPTDEQWLALLRGMPDEDALPRVHHLRTYLARAHTCFLERHEPRLEATRVVQRVADVSNWVGASYPPDLDPEAHLWRRVAKVSEEAGECVEALLGALGENPRKGVTNGMDKVEYELLDTAMAALGALVHITGGCDVVHRMAEHIDFVWHRAGLAGEEAPDGAVRSEA